MRILKKHVLKAAAAIVSAAIISSAVTTAAAEDLRPGVNGEVYIYNWSDYIDPAVLDDFEKETGIDVHYSLLDSNEMLEAKLIAGRSGYDVVAPSLHVLKRLIALDLLYPLDKNKLPNFAHLDPEKMRGISEDADPGNRFGIPYMQLSTGLAYNKDKIRQIMGDDYTIDSWSAIFDPEIVKNFKSCGVTALDSASDMLCTALIYMNRDVNTKNKQDYIDAANMLKKVSPYIEYFHNTRYINDLAAGETCLTVAWAGEVQMAAQKAKEAGKGEIVYVVPKEGALTGYDMFAIPKDAENVDNAHKFLDYIMRPEVIARISNYILAANANKDSKPYLDPLIANDPNINYEGEVLKRLKIAVPPLKLERLMVREWNKVISEE